MAAAEAIRVRNRFEHVDELRPDAVNLTLMEEAQEKREPG
jgi:hypothetical protein